MMTQVSSIPNQKNSGESLFSNILKIFEKTPEIRDNSGKVLNLLLLFKERVFSELADQIQENCGSEFPEKLFDFVFFNHKFQTVKHHIKKVLKPHYQNPVTAEKMLLKLLLHCCYLESNGFGLDSFLLDLVISWLNVNNDRLLFWSCMRLINQYEKFNFFSCLGIKLLFRYSKINTAKFFTKPGIILSVIILQLIVGPKIETAFSLLHPPVFSISEFSNNLEDFAKIKRLNEIIRKIETEWGVSLLRRIRNFKVKIDQSIKENPEYALFYQEVFKQNYSFIMEMMMNSFIVQNGLVYLLSDNPSTSNEPQHHISLDYNQNTKFLFNSKKKNKFIISNNSFNFNVFCTDQTKPVLKKEDKGNFGEAKSLQNEILEKPIINQESLAQTEKISSVQSTDEGLESRPLDNVPYLIDFYFKSSFHPKSKMKNSEAASENGKIKRKSITYNTDLKHEIWSEHSLPSTSYFRSKKTGFSQKISKGFNEGLNKSNSSFYHLNKELPKTFEIFSLLAPKHFSIVKKNQIIKNEYFPFLLLKEHWNPKEIYDMTSWGVKNDLSKILEFETKGLRCTCSYSLDWTQSFQKQMSFNQIFIGVFCTIKTFTSFLAKDLKQKSCKCSRQFKYLFFFDDQINNVHLSTSDANNNHELLKFVENSFGFGKELPLQNIVEKKEAGEHNSPKIEIESISQLVPDFEISTILGTKQIKVKHIFHFQIQDKEILIEYYKNRSLVPLFNLNAFKIQKDFFLFNVFFLSNYLVNRMKVYTMQETHHMLLNGMSNQKQLFSSSIDILRVLVKNKLKKRAI